MPKLVIGEIVCIGPNDEEAIPYDEAVIHLEGDEDSEIRINCPGALRLAPLIVTAVNSHAALTADLAEWKQAASVEAGLRREFAARVAELQKPFEATDAKDWDYLFACLAYGAHGRFWREKLTELRCALEAQP
jgi:hypothetical protein